MLRPGLEQPKTTIKSSVLNFAPLSLKRGHPYAGTRPTVSRLSVFLREAEGILVESKATDTL